MIELLIEFSSSINTQIPLWSILCAFLAGTYFIINMNFKITLLNKEIEDQKKVLGEIKSLVFALLKPEEHKK